MTDESETRTRLGAGMTGVDLWRIALDDDGDSGVLDAVERARAERFHFDLHRRRYVAARARLRRILARYTAEPAHALEFAYGPQGKPHLAAHPELQFNLSHGDDLALVAVTRGPRVGIDLERVRPLRDLEALARSTLAPAELMRLLSLPAAQRTEAFFNAWTRKEAYLKALGTGLSTSPRSFEVSLEPHAEPRLLRVEGEADDPRRWRLHALEPARGWAAAVAVENLDAAQTLRIPSTVNMTPQAMSPTAPRRASQRSLRPSTALRTASAVRMATPTAIAPAATSAR